MTAEEQTAPVAAYAEPTRPVHAGWIAAFAGAWLGLWMAQLVPVQVLLPLQIAAQHASDEWLTSLVSYGLVSAVAGAFVVVAYPIVGALSDRTRSRFGRRRPWILGGSLTAAAGLALLGIQTETVGTIVMWTVVMLGFCMASAALTAVMADQVPEGQRGLVSGWISAPNALGILLGIVLVTAVFTTIPSGYLALAVCAVVLAVPFVVVLRDAPLSASDAARLGPLTARSVLASIWVDPRLHPDFAWTVTSRVLINLGNAIATTMLLYFFTFALGVADPTGFLVFTTVIYMVVTIGASIALGKLSDVLGRRRVFVLASGTAQAVAALLLAVAPAESTAIVGAVLLGLGQGCFFAVDQALATQVLPSAETRGKDVGIMNIAMAGPQAFGPLLGAGAVVLFGGFPGLFIASGVTGLLGAVAVMRVRSVR
ncbi:MFS transporter [Microbacterium testaceum]|uniref:MFS transporter n=1 Tax=Microbacterium testaceum TaxID=2033 RepID=A0A147F6G2_MICTE|nr:MFS transporter [Microbacterium testaceum]KTS02635.1 MFS transporter [Microbacterium testaceum]KTS11166.1 MFS transporter [Microbacterium testaceum]